MYILDYILCLIQEIVTSSGSSPLKYNLLTSKTIQEKNCTDFFLLLRYRLLFVEAEVLVVEWLLRFLYLHNFSRKV